MKKYISLTQAGARSSRSVEEWQALCQAGEIDCRQHNDAWFIAESCLDFEFPSISKKVLASDQIPVILPPKPTRSLARGLAGVFTVFVLLAGLALAGQSNFLGNFTDVLETKYQAAAIALNLATSSATTTATSVPETLSETSNHDSDFSFESLGQTLDQWWGRFSTLLVVLIDRIKTNWNQFLGGQSSKESDPGNLGSFDSLTNITSTSTTDLQKAIDERINSQLRNLLGSGAYYSGSGGSPSRGVVVVPSTGDAVSDAAIRERIGNTFSDQVSVRFDPSGVTGVITPIFQKVPNDNYLFLITPLRQ